MRWGFVIGLLEITVLALGISYVGFDLYFFAAALSWSRQLRHVNRNALLFSGFREVLSFVYEGPVPGVARDLAEPATTTEKAGRLVTEAYPMLRDQLGDTHQRFELPQRLLQLERDARTVLWISAVLAVAVAGLLVFATLTPYGVMVPYGFEALIILVLGNSVLTILFATARAEIAISLRQSEEVLSHARAVFAGDMTPGASPARNQR
jgi:hypothetical protein